MDDFRELQNFEGYRSLEIRSEGEAKTAVIATESPVPMYPGPDGRLIPEVLLMSGLKIPKGKSLPLQDSHNTSSINDTLGRIHKLRIEGENFIGDIRVSAARPDVQQKVDEGTIDSLSVGYRVEKAIFIEDGKTRSIKGREFTGPMVVATDWTPREGSLVAFPADKLAKIRAELINTNEQNNPTEMVSVVENNGVSMEQNQNPQEDTKRSEVEPKVETVDVAAIKREAVEQERAFRSEVKKECDRFKITDVDDICSRSNGDINAARKLVMDKLAEQQNTPTHVVVGEDGAERATEAVRDLFLSRAVSSLNLPANVRERELPKNIDPRMKKWGFTEAGRFILESRGEKNLGYASKDDILKLAVFGNKRDAYTTMGSLPAIFADVANKSLALGYTQYQSTFEIVGRRLQGANNLLDQNVVSLSQISRIDEWADGSQPKIKKLSDKKEKVKVVAYANNLAISWHAMQSDNLDFISQVPQQLAVSCKRTLNEAAWEALTDNPTMSEDSTALFRADVNTKISAGGPTVTNVNVGDNLLRQLTGLDGGKLQLSGRYLVVPGALRLSGEQTCNSQFDPSDNKNQVFNPFNKMICVVEGELDDNSATTFYIFPDNMFSALGYCYLNDQESPTIESYVDPLNDTLYFKERFAAGVGIVEWRGVARITAS